MVQRLTRLVRKLCRDVQVRTLANGSTVHSRQFPSTYTMAVKQERFWQPLHSLEHRSNSQQEQSGMWLLCIQEWRTNKCSIYRPAKTATQSGEWHSHHWRMDWDILAKGHRWENPLMGWQSSADFMQGTHVNFKSKEDAIAFAEKQGYEYFVQEPNTRKFAVKAYANNFLWSDKKLKHIRTKWELILELGACT